MSGGSVPATILHQVGSQLAAIAALLKSLHCISALGRAQPAAILDRAGFAAIARLSRCVDMYCTSAHSGVRAAVVGMAAIIVYKWLAQDLRDEGHEMRGDCDLRLFRCSSLIPNIVRGMA